MKSTIETYLKVLVIVLLTFTFTAFTSKNSTQNYKCMIQMVNYSGEKAYVVVSLMNSNDTYEKTIYVQGDDKEWYPDLKKWWDFSTSKKEKIDAITGATIGNGERNIISISLDKKYINNGYKLRFESAVENQEYYAVDAEVVLDSETIKNKVDGKGYIRYVRMVPN